MMSLPTGEFALLHNALASLPCDAVVLDTESTGGNPQEDRVTEVALIRFYKNAPPQRFVSLVNPQMPIPPFVSRLTGIDQAMVAQAPTFAQLAPTLLPLLEGAVLIAHNSRFDKSLLQEEFARCGKALAVHSICTVKFSKRLYPHERRHSLAALLERHALAAPTLHRAMADVEALCAFLQTSVEKVGMALWQRELAALASPPFAPAWLPEKLRCDLMRLPDGFGVVSFWDEQLRRHTAFAAQQMFTETLQRLHAPAGAALAAKTARIDATLSAGVLHNAWLMAQEAPSFMSAAGGFFTLHLETGPTGVRAQVVPLVAGFHAQVPYGVFRSRKAAQAQVAQWARTHGICAAALFQEAHCDLQPQGWCASGCLKGRNEAEGAAIIAAAAHLPVAHAVFQGAFVIEERHNGLYERFECRGGVFRREGGTLWLFDPALLKTLQALGQKQRSRRLCPAQSGRLSARDAV